MKPEETIMLKDFIMYKEAIFIIFSFIAADY